MLKLEGLGFSKAEVVNELSQKMSCTKRFMDWPLEEVIAFSFLYTKEIAENYSLLKMYLQSKGK